MRPGFNGTRVDIHFVLLYDWGVKHVIVYAF